MAASPTPQVNQEDDQSLLSNRWLILTASVFSMVAVANFQYGWTLFVPPLQKHLKADQAAIQITFTILCCWKRGSSRLKAGWSTDLVRDCWSWPEASWPASAGF